MLVAAHERDESDGVQLVVRIGHGGDAAAVAADAVAESELSIGIITSEGLESSPTEARPIASRRPLLPSVGRKRALPRKTEACA